MPEGPEVRVVADFISKFAGQSFDAAKIVENTDKAHRFSHTPPVGFDAIRDGFYLSSVMTKGKLIALYIFDKSGSVHHALITLGMSGTWVRNGINQKHARISFVNQDGDLTFVDPRCFGTFKLVSTVDFYKKMESIGHDLLSGPMEPTKWSALKSHRRIRDLTVGEALMDQKLFSGIGNIYKSEILYECRIDPRIVVSEMPDNDWSSINQCAHDILRSSYLNKGSTISTFSSDGHSGQNQFSLKVYGKSMAPEGEVKSIDQSGRTTWWCPNRIKKEVACQHTL